MKMSRKPSIHRPWTQLPGLPNSTAVKRLMRKKEETNSLLSFCTTRLSSLSTEKALWRYKRTAGYSRSTSLVLSSRKRSSMFVKSSFVALAMRKSMRMPTAETTSPEASVLGLAMNTFRSTGRPVPGKAGADRASRKAVSFVARLSNSVRFWPKRSGTPDQTQASLAQKSMKLRPSATRTALSSSRMSKESLIPSTVSTLPPGSLASRRIW
mmetsp:Transcript_52271/g.138063  ORF Transcript_52271/g.138063 Transcript_52271/m.138063 type:complete len:211 (-) Transcript_52271:263-895(-)